MNARLFDGSGQLLRVADIEEQGLNKKATMSYAFSSTSNINNVY